MNAAEDSAHEARAWLASLLAEDGAALMATASSGNPQALAWLVESALERSRSLLVVVPDDRALTDISNAIDIRFRPLCLVLPNSARAASVAARATLALLRSRLARPSTLNDDAPWANQRKRIDANAPLWQACLDWARRNIDDESWPDELARLYPVRILPRALAQRLGATAEWVVIESSAPATAPTPWTDASRTLWLGVTGFRVEMPAAVDAAAGQHAEIEVLTQELAELELELATVQAEIADFTRRYHALVGSRMIRLDEARAELALRRASADPENLDAASVAESAKLRAEQSHKEGERFASLDPGDCRPFAPSGDIKKLYRKLAQRIHPDRAADDADRAWRTQLMTEANRAYRNGDESALRELFALWHEGARPEQAPSGEDPARQIEHLKRRITEIENELNRLFGSKLYELFTAMGIAERAGRNLLQEMADRLDADIAAVRAQIDG